MIWNTILISVAKHIELSAEEMRGKFVEHAGKKELIVRDDTFKEKISKNEWKGVITQFSKLIKEYIGEKNHGLFI